MYASKDGVVICDNERMYDVYDYTQGYYYPDPISLPVSDFNRLFVNRFSNKSDILQADFPHKNMMLQVDDLMAPIVLELNKKGYETIKSCNGHMNMFLDPMASLYTAFDKSESFKEFIMEVTRFHVPYIVFKNNELSIPNVELEGWKVRFANDEICICDDIELKNGEICIYGDTDYINKALGEEYEYYNFCEIILKLHRDLYKFIKLLPD